MYTSEINVTVTSFTKKDLPVQTTVFTIISKHCNKTEKTIAILDIFLAVPNEYFLACTNRLR